MTGGILRHFQAFSYAQTESYSWSFIHTRPPANNAIRWIETDYYVFIHAPGPNWLKEQPLMKQPLAGHFQYMRQLEANGKLILGGGFTDGSGTMGVLQASSLAEARQLAENDPAVRAGIVTTQVHPWYVTVGGQVRKSG